MIHGSSTLQIPALADNNIQAWVASLSIRFNLGEVALIEQACELAALAYGSHKEITGVSLLEHATSTAAILFNLNMDAEVIAAIILYATPLYIDNWKETIESRFGHSIANLVLGIHKIEKAQAFSTLEQPSQNKEAVQQQVERLRKMLLAMVQDIRVLLIKLAERTQTLRHLATAHTALQIQVAQEIQGIYAPLANRLGVWQLKWEMEDLSLRYLEPELYKQIAKQLDAKRIEREQYIAQLEATLKQLLADANINGEVFGRPKHIYSIINKMRRKHLSFDQLFDVRAVRILVDSIEDCYAALSLVQSQWQPIAGEFDDYIARPKSNHYQSLHTAVIGPQGLAVEIQIRTHLMHHHSELGVAAHWRYKEGGQSEQALDDKINWLRQILTWKANTKDSGDLLEQYNTALFYDNVYVFTPQGKVIDLPRGSTPIDFAYHLHTELGHRTRGAKVDGHIVPLNYQLQNAQCVEILTHKVGAPSRDWLRLALGYIKSNSARAKVRHWFKHQEDSTNLATGKLKLDKELNRAGVPSSLNQEKIANKLKFNKLDEFFIAIGRGDIGEHQLAVAIQEILHPESISAIKTVIHKSHATLTSTEVMIEGVGNLKTNFAKCCKPVFPEPIKGYTTRDRGVTIHRQTCGFIQRLEPERHHRLLNAQWLAPTETSKKSH